MSFYQKHTFSHSRVWAGNSKNFKRGHFWEVPEKTFLLPLGLKLRSKKSSSALPKTSAKSVNFSKKDSGQTSQKGVIGPLGPVLTAYGPKGSAWQNEMGDFHCSFNFLKTSTKTYTVISILYEYIGNIHKKLHYPPSNRKNTSIRANLWNQQSRWQLRWTQIPNKKDIFSIYICINNMRKISWRSWRRNYQKYCQSHWNKIDARREEDGLNLLLKISPLKIDIEWEKFSLYIVCIILT